MTARTRTARRTATATLLGLACLLLLVGPAAAQEDGGWTITSYDVAIDVEEDGALQVVEELAVDFGPLERRGIFRTWPVRYGLTSYERGFALPEDLPPEEVYRAIDISEVEVTSSAPDDVDLSSEGARGSLLQLRIGDEDEFVTGPQTYRISYRVEGALDDIDGTGQLRWNATGDQWPVPIESTSVTVTGAPVIDLVCAQGRQGAGDDCGSEAAGTEGAELTADGTLAPGEGLSFAAAFDPAAVAAPDPILRPYWSLSRALAGSALALPLAAAVGVLALGGVGVLLARQGRDRVRPGGQTVDGHATDAGVSRRTFASVRGGPVEFRPPDDLRPGQIGVLVDERVDDVDVSATLVDLAVRGHLRIEETTRGGSWRPDRPDWLLRRTSEGAGDDRLLDYEETLLDGLFADDQEVKVSDLPEDFFSAYTEVRKEMYADAVRNKLFPVSPDKTRSIWLGWGLLLLVVSGAVFGLLLAFSTFAAVAVPLLLAGIVLVVGHRWMPHRTPKGSQLLARALGFREFIRTAEAGRMEMAEQENLFVAYLPYAVVFGAVDKWAEAFSGLGTATMAGVGLTGAHWYVSHGGSRPDLGSLSDGLSSFSNNVTSSMTATASSGSSAGGGVSSGGGFGGGGGGSW